MRLPLRGGVRSSPTIGVRFVSNASMPRFLESGNAARTSVGRRRGGAKIGMKAPAGAHFAMRPQESGTRQARVPAPHLHSELRLTFEGVGRPGEGAKIGMKTPAVHTSPCVPRSDRRIPVGNVSGGRKLGVSVGQNASR